MASRPRHPEPEPEPERLQKVIAGAGLASRREAEQWIRAGRVTVNGVAATLGQRVGPRDELRLDGRVVRLRRAAAAKPDAAAYILHRSPGEALSDALLERLPRRAGRRFTMISPMPRIDGGLELATADGALAERLQRRIHSLDSRFSARVRGVLDEAQQHAAMGGELDDGTRVEVLGLEAGEGDELASNHWYHLVVRGASGKQVRQLLERQGAVVSRLLRVAVGPVQLTRDLPRGRFRAVTATELAELLGEVVESVDEPVPATSVAPRAPARTAPRAAPRSPRAEVSPGSRKPGPSRRGPRR